MTAGMSDYVSSSSIAGIAAALAAIYLLWRYNPRYGANPGLPCFPIVGVVPLLLLNKHRLYEWLSDSVYDRSPSLTIRLPIGIGSCDNIATADPRNVEHILRTKFHVYPKGPSFYPFFADLLGSGIFNADGALWLFQRKVASHVFNSRALRDFVVHIADAEIRHRLLPALRLVSTTFDSDPSLALVDLQAVFMDFTLDTVCQFTFGADPACLKASSVAVIPAAELASNTESAGYVDAYRSSSIESAEHTRRCLVDEDQLSEDIDAAADSASHELSVLLQGFVAGFQAAARIVAERFLVPDFVWQIKRRLCIGSEKKLVEAMKAVNDFSTFVIEKSKTDGKLQQRKDILARFMQLSQQEVESLLQYGEADETADLKAWSATVGNESNDHLAEQHTFSLSDSLLKGILLSFILAGRDTVASGVSFLIWLLCVHPAVEQKVYREVQSAVKARESHADTQVDTDPNRKTTFTFDELKKMDYLQAALSESMRLYPPVPSDCKYAAQDDTLPDGTHVQKGSRVSYNVFAMGRSQRVWGKDSHEFRPERWLSDDGQFIPANPYKYPVFQAGPRVCLGKDFAFIQMKLLIANLIRDFEFKISPGFQPALSYGIVMTMVNGLPVKLVKRRTD